MLTKLNKLVKYCTINLILILLDLKTIVMFWKNYVRLKKDVMEGVREKWSVMRMLLEVRMVGESWGGFWGGLGNWRGGFVVKGSGCGRSIKNIGIVLI